MTVDPSPTWLSIPKDALHDANGTTDLVEWLDLLEADLADEVRTSRADDARATALWQHIAPRLEHLRPEEVSTAVAEHIAAAARCRAAEAQLELVRAQRERLATTPAPPQLEVDAGTLRQLLDSLITDRSKTGASYAADVLETLCSLTLDLEVTERLVHQDPTSVPKALADLRNHISAAATMLRALPSQVDVYPEETEHLASAVNRCLFRYAGSLQAELSWAGGEPSSDEAASALVWVLQELLHHLHGVTAGWAAVSVSVDAGGVTMRVSTPSGALAPAAAEPDWWLRSRLRLALAGGTIRCGGSAESSWAEAMLP